MTPEVAVHAAISLGGGIDVRASFLPHVPPTHCDSGASALRRAIAAPRQERKAIALKDGGDWVAIIGEEIYRFPTWELAIAKVGFESKRKHAI